MAEQHQLGEKCFRWQTVGHAAASLICLLVVQKAFLDLLLPIWLNTLERMSADRSRLALVSHLLGIGGAVVYWGFGSLFTLPALLHVKRWKIQVKRTLDTCMLLRCLPLIIFNFLISGAFASLVLVAGLPDTSFHWRAVPDMATLVRDAAVFLAANEVTFFYIHRFLHLNKQMYQAVHKVHHTWTAPISLAAIYCHPLEHILGNSIPLLMGPLLCRSHIFTTVVWLCSYMLHSLGTHSGFWFCDDEGMHDEHHAKFNVNFGVHGIMDSIYGTYRLPETSHVEATR